MKVFSTAIFAVLVLGRQLSARTWRARVGLTLGVVLICHETLPRPDGAQTTAAAAAATLAARPPVRQRANPLPGAAGAAATREMADYLVGLGACLGDVLLSGFVSIYFEKVLKSKASTYSVWDRNFQLAVCSIAIYLPLMFYGDRPRS